MFELTMANQLVTLFMSICFARFCLSASISILPSTTPGCSPGSDRVKDCMSYYCDDKGQWQEFEFIRTHECCLKTYHPACAELGIQYTDIITTSIFSTRDCTPTPSNQQECQGYICRDGQWEAFEFIASEECCFKYFHPMCREMGFTSSGTDMTVTSTEFLSTTTSPTTTTQTPACNDGSSREQNCWIHLCVKGEWQAFHFIATKECCLKEFYPICREVGNTSTEFISTTTPPTTTTPTPACADGSNRENDCRILVCVNGEWQAFEFTATKDCCIKEFHPMCTVMGFTEFTVTTTPLTTTTPTTTCADGSSREQDCMIHLCVNGQWQSFEFIATKECCLKEYHPKCRERFRSTEFISTTSSPTTTTPTPACTDGSSSVQDCRINLCVNGEWQASFFAATKECCLKEFHPMCTVMGFTEFTVTTTPLTTTTPTTTCADGSSREQDCMIHLCVNRQWQLFEFTATKECCLKEFHPKCRERFTSTEFIPTTTSPTTTYPTPACVPGSSREQDCRIFLCEQGQWQVFEFTATKECCLKAFHPKCAILGITSTVFRSSTTLPTPDCSSSTSRVQDCGVYLCENEQWQLFEFFATKECCLREFHPKFSTSLKFSSFSGQDKTDAGTALGITPPDESSPKDWPQTAPYFPGRLDILLLRLRLLPDLPFPATYKPVGSTYENKDNGRPLNPPIHKSAPPKNSN